MIYKEYYGEILNKSWVFKNLRDSFFVIEVVNTNYPKK